MLWRDDGCKVHHERCSSCFFFFSSASSSPSMSPLSSGALTAAKAAIGILLGTDRALPFPCGSSACSSVRHANRPACPRHPRDHGPRAALPSARRGGVAHSYGGVIGLALLAMHPQRVARLVMLDPAFALAPDTANQRAAESIADLGYDSVQDATIGRNDGLGDAINPAVLEDIAEHLVQDPDGRFRFRFHRPAVIAGWGELCTPLPPIALPRPSSPGPARGGRECRHRKTGGGRGPCRSVRGATAKGRSRE